MFKVIVFAPHPDDGLLGCGGSILKRVKEGGDVLFVYMTSGDAGSLDKSKEDLLKIREKEVKNALEVMGVTKVEFLRNDDGYLFYSKKNLERVTSIIRRERPNIIYIPHEKDEHIDHVKTNKIVKEAIRRAEGPCFKECGENPWKTETVLCYEVWTPLSRVSYVEDITEFIDKKEEALKCHESQLKEIKYDQAIRSLNNYRGVMTGEGNYCECFSVLRIGKLLF